ncbi:OmpA family protein [Paracidobacterium acidisoli]|uniref:Flagellar motor protein MotB n=1 Tax=Paracidobacterium acidisoli TaxID=2303751 RepID=A0A372IM34_9BACT|nr:OmpA family protein [Paracidobacterium acidisoli]MBT9332467.1 OmpA family protein [Paracidobacterium acidisoli]
MALFVAASLGLPAVAQSSQSSSQVQTGAVANGTPSQQAGTAETGTGQPPLQTKSNEGFWGHVNPFARKKWVHRQLDPVKDRLNELDELQAKNAHDIKDVDQRAQNGIHAAQSTADQANQTAVAAGQTATQANQTAETASTKTQQLDQTVSTLDQYHQVTDMELRFHPGQTALNAKAKEALDQMAQQVQGQKGYILEVAGYSHARGQVGIQSSQHMAEAVVRYLAEHQVPVYRIHEVAMGNTPMQDSDGNTRSGSAVHVTLMQNSLAALNSSSSNGGSPIGATQQLSAQPSPQGAASQPAVPPQQ